MTHATIKQLIAQGVADALAEYEETRNSGNGNDSHDLGSGKRKERATRECTYSDFLKCEPLKFKGTKETVSHEAAYGMTWKILKKMMNDKYCPRGEIKKLEIELWNLKVKGTDVVSYTQRFQELTLMCRRMFPEESDEIEKYVGGLPDIFKEIRTFAERQVENKRKLDNNNQAQQQPPNKQSVAIADTAGYGERKEYAGTLPLCNKSPVATNNQRTLTCYECENQGHYRSDCPELKNQKHKNQAGGTKARGMVYALGGGETDQDLDNMKDDINA
ncbi:RNA polymerase beta subunit, chloroplastic [Tanacetum coccineum]|uniref:RNA polymerase beta subunit, chloroplastic n=1 Tax=Tanacetum coccineum TaxID=301880 RepID=A0ABQ5F4R7_9ASTR